MVNFKNVSLSFAHKIVLQNLNLQVNRGEHVCIAGESGKGKTSILKLLQGYLQPTGGSVEIEGESVTATSINYLRNKIAYIPQNINLPARSGQELLTLLNLHDKRDCAIEFLEQLGLDATYLGKPFDEISGGQKQRLVIAVCLSLQKEIILMDEPTASLDEASIEVLADVINNLKETTILSTSHNLNWQNKATKVIQL